MKFLKEVYAEMVKVHWPTKQKTLMYTLIVVVISLFIGYYLGALDFLFQNYGLRSLL